MSCSRRTRCAFHAATTASPRFISPTRSSSLPAGARLSPTTARPRTPTGVPSRWRQKRWASRPSALSATALGVAPRRRLAAVLARATRRDPWRLVGLLRVDGRPGSVHEARRAIALVELEERLERLRTLVDRLPWIAERL